MISESHRPPANSQAVEQVAARKRLAGAEPNCEEIYFGQDGSQGASLPVAVRIDWVSETPSMNC